MAYRVYVFERVFKRIKKRYSAIPLAEIIKGVSEMLSSKPHIGAAAPFPYREGVFSHTWKMKTSAGHFQVTALYEVDDEDAFVDIVDIGIISLAGLD